MNQGQLKAIYCLHLLLCTPSQKLLGWLDEVAAFRLVSEEQLEGCTRALPRAPTELQAALLQHSGSQVGSAHVQRSFLIWFVSKSHPPKRV